MGLGALFVVSVTAPVGVTHAAHVGCGQVITADTVLDADIGPCPGDGIIVEADNVTLDLNGHSVLGTTSGGSTTGSTTGIRVDFRTGVRLRNGTVAGFRTGVRLRQRLGNTVERLVIRDNQTHGITISGAMNTVRGNVVEGNGSDGVTVWSGDNNVIEDNVIRSNGVFGFSLIRNGNFATFGTTVRRNSITGNGADGVFLGGMTGPASALSNYISANRRDGVRIGQFSNNHLVEGNQVIANGANGVFGRRAREL